MHWYKKTLKISTQGKGFYPFTEQIQQALKHWSVIEGMCFLYIPHCSASLVINENWDPTARQDMEAFLDHLVPEGQSWFVHTLEGADDSPSHMRAMVTPVSLNIPVDNGKLSLGTWQGIYLAEHRHGHQQREVYLRVLSFGD